MVSISNYVLPDDSGGKSSQTKYTLLTEPFPRHKTFNEEQAGYVEMNICVAMRITEYTTFIPHQII
jgi:hypothetical protein